MSKYKSTKFLKGFELGQNQLSNLIGGAAVIYCNYIIAGSEGCTQSCPDVTEDYMGSIIPYEGIAIGL